MRIRAAAVDLANYDRVWPCHLPKGPKIAVDPGVRGDQGSCYNVRRVTLFGGDRHPLILNNGIAVESIPSAWNT